MHTTTTFGKRATADAQEGVEGSVGGRGARVFGAAAAIAGVRLGALDRSREAIEVYDEVVARFADVDEPALERVVQAAREARVQTHG